MKVHNSHPEIIARLKRAEGHLRKVILMMEQGRKCHELAQQLHAVENSIVNAKRELILEHLDHCLDETFVNHEEAGDLKDEFKSIVRYL